MVLAYIEFKRRLNKMKEKFWTSKELTCKYCGIKFTVFNCDCHICKEQLKIKLCNLCYQVKSYQEDQSNE